MQNFEISFFEDFKLENTPLANHPKKFQKCSCFEANKAF